MRPMVVLTTVLASLAFGPRPALAGRHQHCAHCGQGTYAEKMLAPGKPRSIPHTDERAGWPRELSAHAEPSITPGGIGYYVGGDTPFFGHGHTRRRNQGTWGWDETGHSWTRHRVILGWSRGRLDQGGTGQYATDGPHVPDPIAGSVSRLRSAHAPAEGGH